MAGGANTDDDEGMITAINITPMVDVVLVLLVIFMVTARIIHAQGMPMDLPKASKKSAESIQTIFSVELSADGKTYVDSKEVPNDAAVTKLAQDEKAKNAELRAVIRADQKVEHGRVIHVLDLLKRAGVAKIAFAVSAGSEPPQETPIDTEKK